MKKLFWFAFFIGIFCSTAEAAQECVGTIFLKKPDSWNKIFLLSDTLIAEIPTVADSSGWYRFEISDYVQTFRSIIPKFFFESDSGSNAKKVITPSLYDRDKPTDIDSFSCDIISKESQKFYIEEMSNSTGTTYSGNVYQNAKFLYVLPPQTDTWLSSIPMLHPSNGTSDLQLTPARDRCGWYKATFPSTAVPSYVQIYRKSNAKEMYSAISLAGLASSDTLFYIPGDASLETTSSKTGACSSTIVATFYDTDASLHGAFTCDLFPHNGANSCYDSTTALYNYSGKGAEETVPCIGVTKNIVASTLGSDNKPVYQEASGCFVSTAAFNAIFNETSGINFKHERSLSLIRAQNGNWEYNSEEEPTGAFTPLNDLTDSVAYGTCTGICATAATLREGLGHAEYGKGDGSSYICETANNLFPNVHNWAAINPATGLPYIDSYPTEEGEFDAGTNPSVYNTTSWSDRIEGNNNQQFCMEFHANFIGEEGQTLNVRGDDDIWAFIDKKLVIDLGGTHLAAPARIELDTLSLASGTVHDFALFLCDRRTEMSNFYMSTNIYLSQNTLDTSSGIKFSPQKSSHKIIQTQSGFSISGLQNENVSLYQVNGGRLYHSTGLSGNANFSVWKKGVYLIRIGKVSQLVVFK